MVDPLVEPVARRATGYTLVLPSPWRRIPLIGGTKSAIRKILDEAFAGLPRDAVAPYRREVEQRIAQAVTQARRTGGTELYLPVAPKRDSILAASFVASEYSMEIPPSADPGELVSALAASQQDGQKVTVAESPAVRLEHTAEANPAAGIDFGSRRVSYLIYIPGNREVWLSMAFSTLGAGDPDDEFAKLQVTLFDAIVSTLRWVVADG